MGHGSSEIREKAGSLQSFLLPGTLSRMCLLESSEGGQLSREDLFLLASLHPMRAKY